MEFFIQDPNTPRFPPQSVRIQELIAKPYPDGSRLRVSLELTPFQINPSIELDVMNNQGDTLASASIVEPVAWKLELTLHLRQPSNKVEDVTLTARVIYPGPDGEVSRRQVLIPMKGGPA